MLEGNIAMLLAEIDERPICRLVPYTRELVPIYHAWFQRDPDLLALTASEPLSLEEEVRNQESWVADPNKITFIILDVESEERPCGDVNCFINEEEAEVNVMIAEPQSRRKGIAKAAVLAIMKATKANFAQVKVFVAKIDRDNWPSRKMFESLDFVLVRELDVFNEAHYQRCAESQFQMS